MLFLAAGLIPGIAAALLQDQFTVSLALLILGEAVAILLILRMKGKETAHETDRVMAPYCRAEKNAETGSREKYSSVGHREVYGGLQSAGVPDNGFEIHEKNSSVIREKPQSERYSSGHAGRKGMMQDETRDDEIKGERDSGFPEGEGETELLTEPSITESKEPYAVLASEQPDRCPDQPLSACVELVGKSRSASLQLPSGCVSRMHARVVREERQCRLFDLNSRNGTYLNGKLLTPGTGEVLQEGDRVRFADLDFIWHIKET